MARCLQMMLRIDEYRFAFVNVDGISTLVSVLSARHNFQIQYQLCFCLWVLTFNSALAEKMNKLVVIVFFVNLIFIQSCFVNKNYDFFRIFRYTVIPILAGKP